jgi:uncharacterized protein (DUF302 family)
MAVDGLITQQSHHGPQETLSRLQAAIEAKGMSVFAHIDHAAAATAVGLTLKPISLVIFGNAKGGTPLMQASPTIGIDLPLKALVWQDAAGTTWVSYNDPRWLANRHSLGREGEPIVAAMTAALDAIAKAATASD